MAYTVNLQDAEEKLLEYGFKNYNPTNLSKGDYLLTLILAKLIDIATSKKTDDAAKLIKKYEESTDKDKFIDDILKK